MKEMNYRENEARFSQILSEKGSNDLMGMFMNYHVRYMDNPFDENLAFALGYIKEEIIERMS